MSIIELLDNKKARMETPFTIYPNGDGFRITPQGLMTEADFCRLYPIGNITKDNPKGKNSDTTKDWMYD